MPARRTEVAVGAKRRVHGPFPCARRMCRYFPRARLLRGRTGVSPAFALTWLAVADCFDGCKEDGSDTIERKDG